MHVRRSPVGLIAALAVLALASCGEQVGNQPAASPEVGVDPPATSEAPTHVTPSVPEATPGPEAEEPPPLAPDLDRLARAFVRYALGESDTFPHAESVDLSLGGLTVVSVDDFHAAVAHPDLWRICPADEESYAAASCPVDVLGPIRASVVNDISLVHAAELGEVTCAPRRHGPPPRGRLVVLRPPQQWRTCATDFALTLVADDQGRLRAVDLTLSVP